MAKNQRKHQRRELLIDVELSFLAYEPTPARTRDISKGGMFLEVKDGSEYKIGEILHLRYRDPFHEKTTDTLINATVVRITDNGIGIAFPEKTKVKGDE